MVLVLGDVRYWLNSGKHMLALSFSDVDPKQAKGRLFRSLNKWKYRRCGSTVSFKHGVLRAMEPVIVVHGTFASGSNWWRPEGSFCALLNTTLKDMGSHARCWNSIPKDVVAEYGWSGLNSEASRTHAATILAKRILDLSLKQEVTKLHFVAHSHGGNVLIKALLLIRRKIDAGKLGCFIFLGTPFFSYRSIRPPSLFDQLFFLESAVWTRAHQSAQDVRLRPEYNERYGGKFFAIQSKHDEAFQALRHSIELRNSAYAYSRKWTQNARQAAPVPSSLNPFTVVELRMGAYGIEPIRTRGPHQNPSLRYRIGYFSYSSILLGVVGRYAVRIIVASIAPLSSAMKRWAQRWGTFFGIRAMASSALGDDLAFERIVSVSKVSDVVPTTLIILDNELDEALVAASVAGTDELLLRIYQSISGSGPELEFGITAGAVSEILRAKKLVHSQYYEHKSIIRIVANAISGQHTIPT